MLELIRTRAPWLLAPELSTCAVGSTALAEACRRAHVSGPNAADLDLAWALDVEKGTELLQAHGVFVPTTAASRARGTVALRIGEQRCELTAFRGEPPPDATLDARLTHDLALRDMTGGALAWRLADDQLVDPLHGLQHWRERRIVPCGDPAARVAEHPIRFLRYHRRAHEWGFDLDPSLRRLRADPALLATIPPEALSAELRAALLRAPSPGRFLADLHEVGALTVIAPELAGQFDGRPAGPQRHHPEIGQGLHLVLALEWASAHTADLDDDTRLAVMVAVLCHDLGKNLTPTAEWPRHLGHEQAGLPLIEALLERLPNLADTRGKRLALAVCALHQLARSLRSLKPGTLVDLYTSWFQWNAFPVDAFARAVAADAGGRLGLAASGDELAPRVAADVTWIRECCQSVDEGALWRECGGDKAAFQARVRDARCRALAGA